MSCRILYTKWGRFQTGGLGFVVSHPWHKYKDVPRMGHPALVDDARKKTKDSGAKIR